MPPSDVERVISASRSGLLKDDLVPRMHMMDDRTAAKDSLHLSQLITTEYGLRCLRYPDFAHAQSGGRTWTARTYVRIISFFR